MKKTLILGKLQMKPDEQKPRADVLETCFIKHIQAGTLLVFKVDIRGSEKSRLLYGYSAFERKLRVAGSNLVPRCISRSSVLQWSKYPSSALSGLFAMYQTYARV